MIAADRSTAAADLEGLAPNAAEEHRREILERQLRDRHWTMLALAIAVIAASSLLRLRDSETIGLKWLGVDLPPMCASRMLWGLECPGCGLTRSFVALAAGDVQKSLQFHRFGWLLAAAVVVQIPYRIVALRELRSRVVQRTWPVWFGYILIAALILNWLAKFLGY